MFGIFVHYSTRPIYDVSMNLFCWPPSVDMFNILPGLLWQPLLTVSFSFISRLQWTRSKLHFTTVIVSIFFLCSVTRHKRTRLFCRIIILWEDSWTCPEFKQLWCNAFIPFPRIFISLNEFVTSYRAGYFDRFFIPSGGRVRHFVIQKAWRFLYPS